MGRFSLQWFKQPWHKTGALILLFLLSIPAREAAADVSIKKDWLEVTSDNFIIYSSINEERTVELAQSLEDFRSVFSLITGNKLPDDKVKSYIYLFREARPEMGLEWKFGGLFRQLMRGNYMIIRNFGDRRNTHILQHEYTHYLMHNTNTLEYPSWYDEGFAELMATIDVNDERAELGKPNEYNNHRLEYSPWKSFEWLINVTNTRDLTRDEMQAYYAQSWLLVHYLNFGRENRNFTVDTSKYLNLLKEGKDNNTAFETAYAENLEKIDNRIEIYFNKKMNYYLLPIEKPFPESAVKVKKMKKDVIAARLGFLCFINEKDECAMEFYTHSLELNPERASSHAGIADIHRYAERFEEAEPHYARAIELEPDTASHYLDYAEYLQDRHDKSNDPGEKMKWLEQAGEYFERSLELNPSSPEALVMYGKTFLTDTDDRGRMLKGLTKLSLAHKYMPANPYIKLALAEGYVKMGMKDDARELAERVLNWSHTSASEAASELLDSLEDNNNNDL